MFCATGGICLVNQSKQAAGPFVIGWGAGQGPRTERTYEHQQHPGPFSTEYRMHSCSAAALSTRCILAAGGTALFLVENQFSKEVEDNGDRTR